MSSAIEINKSPHEDIDVVRWNGFIDFVTQANEEELSQVQRIAYIANWYNSEILNGGHLQYLYNLGYFDHNEVISALEELGAIDQCDVLRKVMEFHESAKINMPTDHEKYINWNEEYGYEVKIFEFDKQFYECRPEIETELLGDFVKQNEENFIKWK
ncbi:DMP19 family protein [Lutimonas sp.]|uniref:DMP19 family protein n=1 Tax=Lutimonas sp. TaxID=1872403 RepID=UPI003D9BE2D9